jgi:hypothetical protein
VLDVRVAPHQRVDHRVALLAQRPGIGEEVFHLFGGGRQPGEVEVDAAEERGVVREAAGLHLDLLQLLIDESVDVVVDRLLLPLEPAAIAHDDDRAGAYAPSYRHQHGGLAAAGGGHEPPLSTVATSVLLLSTNASAVTSRVRPSA